MSYKLSLSNKKCSYLLANSNAQYVDMDKSYGEIVMLILYHNFSMYNNWFDWCVLKTQFNVNKIFFF
jgi:hypothetical protein